MEERHINASHEAGKVFYQRQIKGEVVMLNLIKYKEIADYSQSPELAPESPISGEAAYQLYIEQVSPIIHEAGSEVIFMGKGGPYLIGPKEEYWDLVLLVKHQDSQSFLAFAQSEEYQKVADHRTAALEDSRLLPIIP
jgi:uncharacterized protein (DUF1330 family)